MKRVLTIMLLVFLSVGLFISCNDDVVGSLFKDDTPVLYTVTFDLNGVKATTPTSQQIAEGNKVSKPANPTATDYSFDGWYKTKDPTTGALSDQWDFDNGTVTADMTLYAKWTNYCIAKGTRITMGDGSSKSVEELEIGDTVRTFDHETGSVSSSHVCFIFKSEKVRGAFTLHFDNNIDVTVIEEHGFYDTDLNKYVFINSYNAKDYIGHHFYNGDQKCLVELKSYEILNEKVDAYAIITSGHLNHMSEGILSICDGSVKWFANVFEYDSNMKINQTKKAQDIETYGLTEKEVFTKFNGFEEADYEDYNLQYTDIMIGKGLVTWEEIKTVYNLCYELSITSVMNI